MSRTGRTEYQLLLMKASDRGRNVKFLGNNFGCVLSKLSIQCIVCYNAFLLTYILSTCNVHTEKKCKLAALMVYTKSECCRNVNFV